MSQTPTHHAGRRTSHSGSSVTGLSHGAQSGIGMAVLRTQQRQQMLQEISTGSLALKEENEAMEEILSEEHRMLSNADVCQVLSQQFVGLSASSILQSRKEPARLPFRQYKNHISVHSTQGGLVTAAPAQDTEQRLLLESTSGSNNSNKVYSLTDEEVNSNFARKRTEAAGKRGLTPHVVTGGVGGVQRAALGKVNYRVLLEQQSEQNERLVRDAAPYNALVKEVVRGHSRIGEGIA